MENKTRPRSSSLFLMELILAILFFSVASAVCVQIFVRSHVMSRQSEVLNHAVTVCTNTAETFAASEELLLGTTETYYDEAFTVCDKADAAYVQTVSIYPDEQKSDSHLICADITLTSISDTASDPEEQTIYTLHTTRHIARRTGYEKE